jgi:hypothetical protein
MKIVCADVALVDAELIGGLLGCPSCREVLRPWGHARERVLRCRSGDLLLRPRRARCRGCRGTHVLLPEVALGRRQDEVAVIGEAIEAKARGEGHRRIAARVGACPETVRGWLRAFARRAEEIRQFFTRRAAALDVELGGVIPTGNQVADAVEAIAIAGRAWALRFGPSCPWQTASRLSGGWMLCNTNRPLEDGS